MLEQQIKKVHFVGIGGIGMSGLAEVMRTYGYQVTGSDSELTDITRHLQKLGIQVVQGHRAENVRSDHHLLVHTSAVGPDNPEVKAAVEKGIPVIKRAVLLGEFFRFRKGIGVAGTHGKTTTAGLVSAVLEAGDQDPTLIIGGVLKGLRTNARVGKSNFLVAEADEFDRSFLHLQPYISVITNIEADHLDVYKDLTDIRNTFVTFANQTSLFGKVIVCRDDPEVRRVIPKIKRKIMTYGLGENADVCAKNITQFQSKSIFGVFLGEKKLGTAEVDLSGEHNVLNALAAVCVGLEIGIPFNKIAKGLARFKGTGRRLDILAEKNGITIIDDYAHHPTEIRATLTGLRDGWKNGRIIAVFQPHLFTRTKDFAAGFADSLALADEVLLTGIYPAREKPIKGVSSHLILDAMKKKGFEHVVSMKKELLIDRLMEVKKSGDLIVFLGAGDITHVAHKFAGML